MLSMIVSKLFSFIYVNSDNEREVHHENEPKVFVQNNRRRESQDIKPIKESKKKSQWEWKKTVHITLQFVQAH